MHIHELLKTEFGKVAATNANLRASLAYERLKTAQNDRIRLLLTQVSQLTIQSISHTLLHMQIDHERQLQRQICVKSSLIVTVTMRLSLAKFYRVRYDVRCPVLQLRLLYDGYTLHTLRTHDNC